MKALLIKVCWINFFFLLPITPQKDIHFPLGAKSCIVKYFENKNSIATLLSLHDNENTAIDAFNSLPKEISFNLFEMHQANKRWLAYRVNKKDYFFDPNRIFSKVGIDSTLKKCNQETVVFPTEITTQIKNFSDNLLKVFSIRNPNKYIISIHNNTNNGALSLIDYIKPNKYYKEAKDVFKAEGKDLDDFFLVTELNDFNYLKALNENVVLQSDNPNDDGSLSVYCGKNKIPYINIEAEEGHKNKQVSMLEIVHGLLKIR